MSHFVALLGHTQKPTCGVEDYCTFLGQALTELGIDRETARVEWAEQGWMPALIRLWRDSAEWRQQWVVLQYTAGAWSKYGFPIGALAVVGILRCHGVRYAVTFHEPYSWEVPPENWIDRVRAACQNWVIRVLYQSASKAVFADPLETVSWLPHRREKAVFIPIGSNIPEPNYLPASTSMKQDSIKTVAVFCLSDPPRRQAELDEISYALRVASANVPDLRLILVGKGTAEAKDEIEQVFAGTRTEVLNLGIRSPEELSHVLAESDVMLCVRGKLFARRGSALAGVACGVPIIAYAGPAERTPVAEAGVVFVTYRDRNALGAALARILEDEELQAELRVRNRRAQEKYFSWTRIASRHLDALGLSASSAHEQVSELSWTA